jgi:ubiquinone biosynthesis protein
VKTHPTRHGTWRAARRTVRVVLTLAWLGIRVTAVLARHRDRGAAQAGNLVAEAMERLGGAFLKAGQFLSTRRDLVGPSVADALSRLQDRVRPMSDADAYRAIGSGHDLLHQAVLGGPVASGSIACVYRLQTPSGVVALKVRRPGVSAQMTADTRIIRRIARLLSAIPVVRRVPFAEIADQMCTCVLDQLDFAKERANLERFRDITKDLAGVTVPRSIPQLCTDSVLAMEFVEGLDRSAYTEMPEEQCAAAVQTLVRTIYESLFFHGFVHIDLHQGNVYPLAGGRVAVIDFGFAYQLSDLARRKFTSFFAGMIDGDGAGCADTLLSTARAVADDADLPGFRRDIADLVVRNCGRSVRDFSLPRFAAGLFQLQRRHGIYAAPEFTFPLLCLLALEGTVNQYDPGMDFQLEAAPYVMASLLELPAS